MHKVRNVRILTSEMKLLHSRNSHVGHSILILGLTQIQYVGLIDSNVDLFMHFIIEGIRFGT